MNPEVWELDPMEVGSAVALELRPILQDAIRMVTPEEREQWWLGLLSIVLGQIAASTSDRAAFDIIAKIARVSSHLEASPHEG